jgi:hypothetical protein
MPTSVREGQQGENAVQFQILQDGSIPKDSVKLVSSSGKDDLDSASVPAIGEADGRKSILSIPSPCVSVSTFPQKRNECIGFPD